MCFLKVHSPHKLKCNKDKSVYSVLHFDNQLKKKAMKVLPCDNSNPIIWL